MDFFATMQILAIMFWILSCLAIVCGLILTFIQWENFRWEREQREREEFAETVKAVIDAENS